MARLEPLVDAYICRHFLLRPCPRPPAASKACRSAVFAADFVSPLASKASAETIQRSPRMASLLIKS